MRWIVALAASSMVLVASAIEPPKNASPPAKPPPKEEPANPSPSDAPPDAPSGGQAAGDTDKPAADAGKTADTPGEDDEELPPLPPDTVPSGPPPQRFTPSEKVRADFPVSFPIDI